MKIGIFGLIYYIFGCTSGLIASYFIEKSRNSKTYFDLYIKCLTLISFISFLGMGYILNNFESNLLLISFFLMISGFNLIKIYLMYKIYFIRNWISFIIAIFL